MASDKTKAVKFLGTQPRNGTPASECLIRLERFLWLELQKDMRFRGYRV